MVNEYRFFFWIQSTIATDVKHTATRLIRNIPRMKEIATVAAKFGFGEVIRNTKIGDFLDKIKISHEAKHLSAPVRFRLALESLGPTFMKLGQVLSMRPDLIPPDWSEELANLQDSCPTNGSFLTKH